jgi:hypothetical protein
MPIASRAEHSVPIQPASREVLGPEPAMFVSLSEASRFEVMTHLGLTQYLSISQLLV